MQDNLQISYIGHATCVVQCGEIAVLTDPHLGRRLLWWKRPADQLQDLRLPDLRAILVSHTHPDHLNLGSYKYIAGDVAIVVPPHAAGAIHPFVNNPIVELAHWIPHPVCDGLTITPVPARHYGGRWIPQLRYREISAFIITIGGHNVYFTGDTSYGTHFREVGHVYPIDVALLPISSLLPRWLTPVKPMGPLDVFQAFHDLQAKVLVPTHWGTFGNAKAANLAIERLRRVMEERDCLGHLRVLPAGGGAFAYHPTEVGNNLQSEGTDVTLQG